MKRFTTGGFGPVPEEILAIYPKINVSGLKQFNVSPAYFESMQILKEIEPTKAMDLGTKLHYAILEPEKFEELFCEEPAEIPADVVDTLDDLKKWCANEGLKTSGTKAELVNRLIDHGTKFRTYDEFMNDYLKGRQILKAKEARAAKRIISRIRSIKAVDSILKNGEIESLGWVLNADLGVVVTFRVDYFKHLETKIAGYENFAIDLKTTSSLSTQNDLQKFIANDETHIQMAFYADAIEFLTGRPTAAAVLAVETTAPYTVMLSVIDGATIECGRADYMKNLAEFVHCHKTGIYPTNYEKIGTVGLPNWKLNLIEAREAKYMDDHVQ